MPVVTHLEKYLWGTSLVVQWLRLCTPNAGTPGSIPGQGTGSHMPQLKLLNAAMIIDDPVCCNQDLAQPIKNIFRKEKENTCGPRVVTKEKGLVYHCLHTTQRVPHPATVSHVACRWVERPCSPSLSSGKCLLSIFSMQDANEVFFKGGDMFSAL